MRNIVFLLLTIASLQSCKTLSYIPLPSMNFHQKKDQVITKEDQVYLKILKEKTINEISDCLLLGTTTGEGGGGLAGKWEAKKNVKIEAAKNRADTVVFGPDPAWELSKTTITGSYFRCKKDS